MKRDETLLIARAKYIQDRIAKSERMENEIKQLSRELFLTQRTIYADLKKRL